MHETVRAWTRVDMRESARECEGKSERERERGRARESEKVGEGERERQRAKEQGGVQKREGVCSMRQNVRGSVCVCARESLYIHVYRPTATHRNTLQRTTGLFGSISSAIHFYLCL